jgi:hypothetical protein
MGKVRVGLIVVATVLVLAGCVGRLGGDPERAPATGEPVRLDFSTLTGQVDPCSLTGPAAFQPYGVARMPGRPDMDSCRVSVATDHGPVYVWVGEQTVVDLLPGNRTMVADLGRGATVERYGDGCDTALVYDAASAITVVAASAGDEQVPEELLCDLTGGAAKGVFNVLAGDRVKFWTPPPNSLATLALCEVTSRGLATEQLDLPSTLEPVFAPNAHWCRWGGLDGNWATLRTPVAETPAEIGVPAGAPVETIAGRESWVVAGRVSCTIYYQHIEFGPGVGTFEFAELTVTMPDGSCAAARTLAASAWEHLPSPN